MIAAVSELTLVVERASGHVLFKYFLVYLLYVDKLPPYTNIFAKNNSFLYYLFSKSVESKYFLLLNILHRKKIVTAAFSTEDQTGKSENIPE